jgi:hypothetical protein
MAEYAAAKAELGKIFRQLEQINPSAARSLEEGMEETLDGAPAGRGRTAAQNIGLDQSDRVVPVDRQESSTKREALARKSSFTLDSDWVAGGATKFRRVKGYGELDALQHRLNP